MSSHSFGLREDPFALALTLSAEETVQLIQGRVSARGGDGSSLFPPETCFEIHRWAGGNPGAIWRLAAEAMRLAAEAGEVAVSANHVRVAARSTTPEAEIAVPSETSSAHATAAEAAPAGGFHLPTEPLGHLDPGARAWVARFIGSGDRRRAPATGPPPAPTLQEIAATQRQKAPRAGDERSRTPGTADIPSMRAGGRRRRPRRNRLVGVLGMAVATPLLIVAAILLYLFQRREQAVPRPWTGSPTLAARGPALPVATPATDSTVAHGPLPSRLPMTPIAPARPDTFAPRVPTALPAPIHPAAPSSTGAAAALASPTRPESVRREGSNRRLGLEVANFIVEGRALSERDRLAASGHSVHVRTEWENGTATYRVVLGSFASRSEAERVADELLSNGTVRQARVVSLGKRN